MVLVERDGHRLVLEANRDITERKCTEILLARLAAIVESSDDAIIAKDLAGIITDWNAGAETIFGYSAREMIGQSILRLIPLDRRQEEAVILEKLRQGQSVPHFDTIRQHKTGAFIDVSVTVSAIKDATGNVVGASKIARDISTRKRADEAIRQLNAELEERVTQRTKDLAAANKELEAFSFSVSHDLRAPLRSIIGFSQIASDDYGAALPESGRRCLTTIRESAMQMNTLIDDLLTFARFTATPLQSREIDVNLLVGNVIAQLSGTLEKRQIDWHIGDLPDCPGDPALLRQVWMNLLSNALKYTRKKDSARIEVRGEAQSGQVTYFVRDNGTGFDMRYAHKLFGVFQRLHRSEDYEGNGIGLALAQRIVRRHGGCLWAEAVPGQGATFYVSLPRTRRHEDHLDNAPQI
jgi:PAS domain S-box-containing protein